MVVLNSKEEVISKTKTTEVKVKISEECKTKYSLHHMSLSGFDFYSHYSEENKSEYPLIIKRKGSKINIISIPVTYKVNPKDQATFGVSSVTLSVRDSRTSNSNSESSVLTINSIYNEKTKALEANWPDIDSVLITSTKITTSICGYKVKTHEINFNKIESVQGDEIHFKLKKGKETTCDNKDSTCTASLTLSEDITLKSSITGSFQTIAIDGVSVTQKDKALSDLEVEAIVEMKSCKEASIYVAIPLKYNDKTGTYANSKALALCNKAGMTVLSMDVVAKGKGLPLYKWTHVAFTHSK